MKLVRENGLMKTTSKIKRRSKRKKRRIFWVKERREKGKMTLLKISLKRPKLK